MGTLVDLFQPTEGVWLTFVASFITSFPVKTSSSWPEFVSPHKAIQTQEVHIASAHHARPHEASLPTVWNLSVHGNWGFHSLWIPQAHNTLILGSPPWPTLGEFHTPTRNRMMSSRGEQRPH